MHARSRKSGQDDRMARPSRLPGPLLTLIVALGLGAGFIAPLGPAPVAAADSKLPAWDGGINLYREGTFTTQKSWLWCTAADVQIIHNIVERATDHTTSSQRRYFDWMRAHNKYALPESAGVDPQGWTAGLRHFVDDRYRLVASKSFDAALTSAVTNLRRTNLPVAVAVAHGGHGWVLTGFTATADPLRTSSFKVTSVRVVGPLYGLQSKNGYDMRPNTKLTTAQFRGFFTAWHYDPKPMIWDGLYVSIQPIPAKVAAVPAPTPRPAVATPSPSPTPSPSASPSLSPAAAHAMPSRSPAPIAAAAASQAPADPVPLDSPATAAAEPPTSILVMTLAALAVVATLAWRNARPLGRGRRGPTR
jgi:hypothetical protein